MAVPRVFVGFLVLFAFVSAIVFPSVQAQSMAPAPTPASDGNFLFNLSEL